MTLIQTDPATAGSPPTTAFTPGDGRPSSAAVEFDGVSRRFGDVLALDDVRLSIRPGETVALLGPNGAGKSTAIGLMLGLLEPTSGAVSVLGMSPRQAVASGRIGSMLQQTGLPPNVRVGELVDFARRLYPHPLSQAAVLERSGLTDLSDRSVDRLSGGESQRLRFAIGIAGDPDLVFLDEPTVAMDVETRRAFWADMRRSASEGRTILFATHYLEEADQVADRVVVLDHGRIVADGTGRAIRARIGSRTIRFDLADADATTLATLPAVTEVDVRGNAVRLVSDDADRTVREIFRMDLPIHDLEVTGADLEDAFIALTSPSTTRQEGIR
jgi:ABC-2 type transport system ATP-binding protein